MLRIDKTALHPWICASFLILIYVSQLLMHIGLIFSFDSRSKEFQQVCKRTYSTYTKKLWRQLSWGTFWYFNQSLAINVNGSLKAYWKIVVSNDASMVSFQFVMCIIIVCREFVCYMYYLTQYAMQIVVDIVSDVHHQWWHWV